MRSAPEGTVPAADVDFSGTVEKEDEDRFQAALAAYDIEKADYDPRADLDRDGDIDSDDESRFYESFDRYLGLSGNWKLSQGDGLIPGNAPGDGGYDNRFGWRGYWYDSHLQKYHVRHRVYDPREGRWMQNDPLGFGAGDQDLYRYCGGEYSMGYDPLGLESGMGETITTGGDGCVCGDERGGTDNAPQGRRGDIFDQLGVGEDRLNGNTRAGQRERSEDSLQIGRNVTGVAYGLNNGIADAAGGFFSMFNPVNILQAIQSTNKRLNALAEGDPLPMLDFLLSPVDAANGIADRWNNASEEERYYMVSYGTGYVGTTAALTYASGVALPVGVGGIGMNSLRYSGGIGRVYYIIDVSNGGKAIRIGQTMRGFYANGELIRAGENIRKLYASGRYTSLDYIIVETLPRGCTRADVLRAEAYHFRLYQLSKRNTRSLPPENPVMR